MSYSDWKIKVRGADKSVTASYILDFAKKDGSVSLFGLRRELTDSISESEPLLVCEHCDNPIIISRKQASIFLKHQPNKKRKESDKLFSCPFYKGKSNPIYDKEIKEESRINKFVKRVLMRCLLEYKLINKKSIQTDPKLYDISGTGEWRSPDVLFELKDGSKWAFEVINVWLNPQFIAERERFYNKNGINLIWLIPEERLNTTSVTYGDLMFGNSGHHNVFTFTYGNIKRSIRSKDLFVTVHYPKRYTNSDVRIESTEISFSQIKSNLPHGTPYAFESNDIIYSDIRQYLLENGLIGYIRADDELLIEARRKMTDEIMRLHTSTKRFIFNDGILLSYRDKVKSIYGKLDTESRESLHKKYVKTLDRININIDMLNAIEQHQTLSGGSFERDALLIQIHSVRKRMVGFENHDEAQRYVSRKLAEPLVSKFSHADKLPYLIQDLRVTPTGNYESAIDALAASENSKSLTLSDLLTTSYATRLAQRYGKMQMTYEQQQRLTSKLTAFGNKIESHVKSIAHSDLDTTDDSQHRLLPILIKCAIEYQKETANKLLSKDYLLKTEPLVLLDFLIFIDALSWTRVGFKSDLKKIYTLVYRYSLGLKPVLES